MAEQIDQLARMTPQERKILEGIASQSVHANVWKKHRLKTRRTARKISTHRYIRQQ